MTDAPSTPRLTAERIDFTRILLTVRGTFEGSTADLEGLAPHYENARTGARCPAGELTVDGSTFTLKSRIMHVDEGQPLHSGSWRLVLVPPAEEPPDPAEEPTDPAEESTDPAEEPPADAILMSAGFRLDPHTYRGLFTYGRIRYWVVPTLAQDTGGLCLSILYRKLPGARRSRWRTFRSRVSRVEANARSTIFHSVYKLTQRLVPRNGKRVLFTSDSRLEMSGNLSHVHERMCARELDKELRLLTIFKPSIKARRKLLDKFRFAYYLAIADVILMDDYQPMLYKVDFAPDVKIIQVWHASGAFKTVGYSRIGKAGGPEPFSSTHKIYTHAIVNSEHDIPFYAEAFGIPEDRVHATGIPRTDLFFDEQQRVAAIERAYAEFPEARGKKTILFAPTFRGRGLSDAYYDYELLDLEALYAVCAEQDAYLIFKSHPFISEKLEIPERFADRFVDAAENREINDILMISDLVITDYSSLVFEYSTLDRPMLFFAYDLEEYEASRDFYEGLVAFAPGKIVRTFDELLETLRTGDFEQQKVAEFARRHFSHTDGRSADRVIDELVLGRE